MKLLVRNHLFILIFLCIAASLFSGGKKEAVVPRGSTDPSARIVYLEGDVLLAGVQAEIGDSVAPGSTIVTKAGSLCELVFGEKNILRIDSNTELILDIGGLTSSIKMEKGAFGAVFNRLETFTADAPFRVTTPAAGMGIRGTAFYIAAESDDATYICTCNGIVTQQGTGDPAPPEKEVSAARHAAWRYSLEAGETVIEQAAFLYHDDAYINSLAEKTGETVPWGKAPEDRY